MSNNMSKNNNKPNIVLFMPETVRADVIFGKKGEKARTPNMDALAREGTAFTNFYSQSPFCTPSRCSMFTGRYLHANGHRSLQFLLQKHERNLFRDLKENGYTTVCYGKNDLVAQNAIDLAFDSVEVTADKKVRSPNTEIGASGTYQTRESLKKHKYAFYEGKMEEGWDGDWAKVETALDFIEKDHDKPFCLFLPLSFAHPAYTVEDPFFSLHDRGKTHPPVPQEKHNKNKAMEFLFKMRELGDLNEEDLAEIRATYFGMISRLDYQLGLIIDKLKQKNIYDNTAIFAFSDHGDYAGDYGQVEKINYSFEDTLLNIPLIARIPGMDSGLVRKTMVEGIDLYPTIMELTGIEPKHYHHGKSILPQFDRKTEDSHRDCVFAEAGYQQDEKHCLTSLEPHIGSVYEKQIRYWHEHPEKVKEIMHRRVMIRTDKYKYVYSPAGYEELYDLEKDQYETDNVVDIKAYEDVKEELKNEILQWYVKTSDVVALERDKRSF